MKPRRIILQPLNLMKFALPDIGLLWDLTPLLSFLFLPFGMGMSIFCLFHHSVLEAHGLSGFIGSQLERILPQDKSYLRSYLGMI